MENLPSDIQHCLRSLDAAWATYRAPGKRDISQFEIEQEEIKRAKTALINCLNRDIL